MQITVHTIKTEVLILLIKAVKGFLKGKKTVWERAAQNISDYLSKGNCT